MRVSQAASSEPASASSESPSPPEAASSSGALSSLDAASALEASLEAAWLDAALTPPTVALPVRVCAAFTALLLYYKPASEMFGYSPLGVTDILISVGMAAIVFILMQLTLFLIEVKKNKKPSSLRSGGSGDGQGKENEK